MFMYEAIGPGHAPDVPGYAADGIIAHAVIPGTEGIGDKKPHSLRQQAEEFIEQRPLIV